MLGAQYVVLLGPPGSGKGTQAKKIASQTGYCHLSTGDLVRDHIKAQTALGRKIQSVVESGAFPKDDIIIELVHHFIKKASSGIVFDGFPRTLPQAETFMTLLSCLEGKTVAIRIDVPEYAIIERLERRYMCSACGEIYSDDLPLQKEGACDSCQNTSFIRRKDDEKDAVRKRLSVYATQTEPIVQFLSKRLPFFIVDGLQKPAGVTCDIMKILEGT